MLRALLFISRLFNDVFGMKHLPTTVRRKPSAGTNSFTKITLLFGMMEPKCWVEIYTISLQTPKSMKLIISRWRYELVFFHLSQSFLCPIHFQLVFFRLSHSFLCLIHFQQVFFSLFPFFFMSHSVSFSLLYLYGLSNYSGSSRKRTP